MIETITSLASAIAIKHSLLNWPGGGSCALAQSFIWHCTTDLQHESHEAHAQFTAISIQLQTNNYCSREARESLLFVARWNSSIKVSKRFRFKFYATLMESLRAGPREKVFRKHVIIFYNVSWSPFCGTRGKWLLSAQIAHRIWHLIHLMPE